MSRALLLSLLALASCGTRGSLYTSAIKPLPLVATSGAMVQVVPQTRRAVRLTPGQPVPVGLTISPGARFAARVALTDTVVILAGTARAPKLDVIDVPGGEVQTLDVPGFFDSAAFSPDGRFGVLVYNATAGTGPLAARNLNEVALVAMADRSVTRLQLDTESLAPRAVLFGPAQPNRQLVAVTLERGVAIFDALHPSLAPRRISIQAPGSTVETSVLKAVFSHDAHWLFLRATNLDDVIAIELGPEVGTPLAASINFVAGGRGLTDLAAPPEGFDDAVLAVYAASQEAMLLDAHGIQDSARRVSLPAGFTHLQRLQGSQVMFWSESSRTVAAWDFKDGRSGTATLDGAFSAPQWVPLLNKAVFPHASVSSSAGSGPAISTVTVVDETNRLRLRIQGIQLAGQFGASSLDATGQRLFFTIANGTTLVTMDLRTLQLAEVTLDTTAAALSYLPQGDWLVASSNLNPYGDLTALPAGAVDRTGAMRFSDFAFTGDLDRPGDAP